jgi:hypothetical protein
MYSALEAGQSFPAQALPQTQTTALVSLLLVPLFTAQASAAELF